MIFGQIFGQVSFGNPVSLPQFTAIAWEIQCAPTVAVENEDRVDDADFIQVTENLWVVQNPESSGTLVKEC